MDLADAICFLQAEKGAVDLLISNGDGSIYDLQFSEAVDVVLSELYLLLILFDKDVNI